MSSEAQRRYRQPFPAPGSKLPPGLHPSSLFCNASSGNLEPRPSTQPSSAQTALLALRRVSIWSNWERI